MDESINLTLLQHSLELAVAIEVENLKHRPWPEVVELGRAQVDTIASKGDIILYKSKKGGETAKAFASLARAVAVASFFPGGIRVFDLHFKAEHPGATS